MRRSIRAVPVIWAALLACAWPPAATSAQAPTATPDTRGLRVLPREDRQLPHFAPEPPQPEFVLPPVPPPPPDDLAGGGIALVLKTVRLRGSTVLSPEQVAAVARPYVGRRVTSGDLYALRQALSRLYVDAGYLNSGVVLPDQAVENGTVVFQAVEGTLTEVDVRSDGRLRSGYVRRRLAAASESPINVDRLREDLQMLQRDPLIERINGAFTAGRRAGEATLRVDVAEAPVFAVALSLDNGRSPSIGAQNRGIALTHRNVTGFGDALTLRYHRSDGLDERGATYRVPVSPGGAVLEARYRHSESNVVEAPFDAVDIGSTSEDVSLTVEVPLRLTLSTRLAAAVQLESRHSRTTLLGRPFSFSAGVNDGRAEVSVARVRADWLKRSSNWVVALRSTLSVGVDVLDATRNARRPDTRFTSWLGQAQWVRRLSEHSQLLLRGDVQLAADPLLPQEQYALGGASTVRGYRENLLVRDSGWLASAEWRRELLRSGARAGSLQLAVFADYGRGWNKNRATPAPASLSSAGLGLLWSGPAGLYAQVYRAEPFRTVAAGGDDLQDDGLHFSLGWRSR